ncbi:MAG: XdhC family protein [Bacteroidetes Order II. Incertae sedis bacterium]|nr:XdhC family protein [Bacteroidetes Order II. bacterium]
MKPSPRYETTDFWKKVAEELSRRQVVQLMVVVQSSGSSPGRAGFKMAVTKETLWGSIGGGIMEMNMVAEARKRLDAAEVTTILRKQVHRKNAPEASGMICSGEQMIVFMSLFHKDLLVVNKILNCFQYQNTGLRITPTGLHLVAKTSVLTSEFDRSADGFTYTERLDQRPQLFLIGGGHCGLALSELMAKLGFCVRLFDNRPHLNTIAANHFTEEVTILDYTTISSYIPEGAQHYVVVMTLGFHTDEVVMRQLLGKTFAYLGVLGSVAKMKTLLHKLRKEGFSEQALALVHTPIGLPIHSKTPMEIAVSIAAEIIQVKNEPNPARHR